MDTGPMGVQCGRDPPAGTVVQTTSSGSEFSFAPGAALFFPVTPDDGLGVDARFVIISGSSAFDTFLTCQYQFWTGGG